jgi:hypothetical protein
MRYANRSSTLALGLAMIRLRAPSAGSGAVSARRPPARRAFP